MTLDISYFQFTTNDHSRMIVFNNIKKFNSKARPKAACNFMVQTCTENIRELQYGIFQYLANQKSWTDTGKLTSTWKIRKI